MTPKLAVKRTSAKNSAAYFHVERQLCPLSRPTTNWLS